MNKKVPVSFLRGAKATMPEQIIDGMLYITTDERRLYADISDTQRIAIGEVPVMINVYAEGNSFVADKTYEEIALLLANGNHLYCRYDGRFYNLMVSDSTWTVFNIFDSNGTVLDYTWIIFRPNGNIAVTSSLHDLNDIVNEANAYTDKSIADMIGAAPAELDTIEELAKAFQENDDVVEVLNQAITTKYDAENPPPIPLRL